MLFSEFSIFDLLRSRCGGINLFGCELGARRSVSEIGLPGLSSDGLEANSLDQDANSNLAK